jgi:hypothetical protein
MSTTAAAPPAVAAAATMAEGDRRRTGHEETGHHDATGNRIEEVTNAARPRLGVKTLHRKISRGGETGGTMRGRPWLQRLPAEEKLLPVTSPA